MPLENSDFIIIFLCVPSECIKQVKVYKKMKINQLQTIFPEKKKSFLFNGDLLEEKMTLEFYGIRNHSNIFVIPKTTNKSLISEKWSHLTKNCDEYNENIRYAVIEETKNESARIRDLQLIKLENKSRQYNKLCKNLISNIELDNNDDNISSNIPNINQTPSISPLPAFWIDSFENKFNHSSFNQENEEKLENILLFRPKQI